MQNYEVFIVHYPGQLYQKIIQVFQSIQREYAIVSICKPTSDIQHQITLFKSKKQFSKRKVNLIIIDQVTKQITQKYSNIWYMPHQCISDKKHIVIDGNQNTLLLIQETIKALQLDYIWLGVLSKLGSDVKQLRDCLIKYQNFNVVQVGLEDCFLKEINTIIKSGQTISPECLKSALEKMSQNLQSINSRLQNEVRQRFNSRIIITDITDHKYINLLNSRNYFNLIMIECPTIQRFTRFSTAIQQKYKQLYSILTLEVFLVIDDFWYSHCLSKCIPDRRFSINRQIDNISYPQLIKKYHDKIVRPFRPTFHQYFISICQLLKKRAGCIKEAVGSIIVKDKKIIANGYNGTPFQSKNCYNGGCKVCNNSQVINTQVLSCDCIHAEYRCILEAGIKITPGSTLYTTRMPCLWCSKLIIQARIIEIVYIKTSYDKLKCASEERVIKTLGQASITLTEVDEDGYQIKK